MSYLPEERQIFNNNRSRQEVVSVYDTDTLVGRLHDYASPDSLIVYDIDGTLRPSTAKYLVLSNLTNPARWKNWVKSEGLLERMTWPFDMAWVSMVAFGMNWDWNIIEEFCLNYAESFVLDKFDDDERKQVMENSSTPFYPGAREVVDLYSEAQRILVSRTFEELVEQTREQLGMEEGLHRVEEKAETVLGLVQERGVNRVLLFGDLEIDLQIAGLLKDRGIDYDMVLVNKQFDYKRFDDRATIFIPRNWRGLLEMLRGETYKQMTVSGFHGKVLVR
ncbi:hypothetical protein HOC98_03325 [archaeon]|nr:hypothetical protein [archaeon]